MGEVDELVVQLMDDFARRTGLDPVGDPPRRYLWTDAFAVCVYLDLGARLGDSRYRELAFRLVGQVHEVLGRHRPDDRRTGWISGLGESEGAEHPTAGGLRIGKSLPERSPGEPADPLREWEQDGQYYHYITKWMHALERVAQASGDARYLRWSIELAKAAHAGFTHTLPGGRKRMYWKMSIDLARPLVPSMGQHDALDGLVTFIELQRAAGRSQADRLPDLTGEIADLTVMARAGEWATDDPLGAGSLLTDAWRLMQADGEAHGKVLGRVLEASVLSLGHIASYYDFQGPAIGRLAFREEGLSIGLRAVEAMGREVGATARLDRKLGTLVSDLGRHVPLAGHIERFWSDPKNRGSPTWVEHEDINAVMLAASLSPGEFLRI